MKDIRAKTTDKQREWLESQLERRCRLLVIEAGGIAYKFNSESHASVPDRMIVLPGGQLFFVEFKRWGKVPTPLQFSECARLINLGQHVYFVDNLLDFKFLLGEILSGTWPLPEDISPPGRGYDEFFRELP